MATIRKRGNSYQIRVSEGYDSKGKQVIRTKSWKPSPEMTAKQVEKELQRQAVIFEEQCLKGIVTTNVKFEELAERWFEEYASINLKKSSFQRMRASTIRVYPAFGHLHISKITRGQIQSFIDDLTKNGKNLRTGKPLSRKSVIHHLNLLSDVFSYALRLELIPENPCKSIFVPKVSKKEKAVYTVEEVKQLLKLLEEYAPLKYQAFITLAVYSGFRRGELMGLEWKDIDFENNVISVRRTSNYTSKDGSYTDTTKTKRSVRSLKMPDNVMGILKQLRAEQLEAKEKLGTRWVDSDRLFVNDEGAPLFCGTPYNFLLRFTKRHNMRFCDVHSYRHFNASVLINSGIDATVVSSALGHSAVSTTTGIYLHVFQEYQARTSEAIAKALNFTET